MGIGLRPAVHFFTYADSMHPMLCTLAASVAHTGGRLNVIGLRGKNEPLEVPEQARPHVLMRKLLSLRPVLARLEEEDLVMMVDAFDVVIEAPSLQLIEQVFDQLQLQAGPLIAPAWGPVVFTGESNCWPFQHPQMWAGAKAVDGAYRGDFIYSFGENFSLRGDEVCNHWLHFHTPTPPSATPLWLPFPNSGALMGRVGSLRKFFELALEVLDLFNDHDEQALLYSMVIRAAADLSPWVPLVVDAEAHMFASLHGQDFATVAANLRSCEVCSFQGRKVTGFFLAAVGDLVPWRRERPNRWTPGSHQRLPVLVPHFNGDTKVHLGSRCPNSIQAEALQLGFFDYSCRLIDFVSQTEAGFGGPGFHRPVRQWWASQLLPVRRLHGIIEGSRKPLTAREALLSLDVEGDFEVVEHMSEETGGAVASCPGLTGRTHIRWRQDPAFPSELKAIPLGAILVGRNVTSTHTASDVEEYCKFGLWLRHAWACLSVVDTGFTGFLLVESTVADMVNATDHRNPKRFEQLCADQVPDENGKSVQPAPRGQAVEDFLDSLQPWEAVSYRWSHWDISAFRLAVKELP